jgi:glycosyltransferase involved in cell wall biosynthesis
MRLPRLLFVVTEDWYFVSHRLPLAVVAQKAGFDVAVATRVGEHGETIRAAEIRLIPFSLSRRRGNPLREVAALERLYFRERPDIVHHVALKPVLYGALAARLAGVPQVVNAIAGLGWLFTSSGLAARILRPVICRLLAWLLGAPHSRTIVQNPDDFGLLIKMGVPEDRLRLIRGAGVDTEIFTPALESPPEPVTVLFSARMLWAKGVGEFVEAARQLTQAGVKARSVLVGDPDPGNPASVPVATLRAWHGHNGVEWWGQCDNMPAVFRTAHIACLPSYYREGLPKVLLEAAACGLPIVTTDAPGCREIVRDGDNGFLVPARDAKALAVTLRSLIDNVALRAKMGQRARAIVLAEFSQERVIAETLAVYQELIR